MMLEHGLRASRFSESVFLACKLDHWLITLMGKQVPSKPWLSCDKQQWCRRQTPVAIFARNVLSYWSERFFVPDEMSLMFIQRY